MSKKLVTTKVLEGGIRRYTLANDVKTPETQYAAKLKRHFGVPSKESLHLLDCSQIRTIGPDIFKAILEIHKRLASRKHRLAISAGDNTRRYLEYRQNFNPKGIVDVYLTEEQAIRELRAEAARR
ncbi:MAG: hypothetical protein WCT08_04240 [Patescibacteria group bacterium]|jgi:hypothetical protein